MRTIDKLQFNLQLFGGGGGKNGGKAILGVVGFAFGAGWLGGGIGFGASTAIMGGLYGASLASTLWSAFNPPKLNDISTDYSRFDAMMNQISSEAMIPIVYGTRKWGGNQSWHNAYNDNKNLTKDVILCEGEIDSISDIRANDLSISSLSGCSYVFRNGASTQQPPDNYSVVGGYKNMAWLRVNLRVSNQLQGSNPTITSVIKGTKVLTWENNTWVKKWSDNPSYCLLDFLTNRRYGLGHWITWDMIDLDSFRESAAYCAELVTTKVPTMLDTYDKIQAQITKLQQYLNSSGLSQDEQTNINNEITRLKQAQVTIQSQPVTYTLEVTPRYALNIIIDQKKDAVEVLSDILSNFAGFLVYTNGRVALRIEKATPSSFDFDDTNTVADSVVYEELTGDNQPNRFTIGFFDPNNNWTQVKCIVENTVDQQAYPRGRGKIINKNITLTGCTSQSQALRLGRLFRDISMLCNKTVTFKTAYMAMHLEPGDVVTWTDYTFINGVKTKLIDRMPVRILEISHIDGLWTIKAQQYNESIYNDSLGAEIQVRNPVAIPNPLTDSVPDPTGFSFGQTYYKQKDGTIVSDLAINWDDPGYPFLSQYILYYSINNGQQWNSLGTTTDNSFVLHNAIVGKNYIVKIVTENSVGRKSYGVTLPSVLITGKDSPPSDVTAVSASFIAADNTKIKLQWTGVTDVDFNRYSLRYGSTWESGIIISDSIFDNSYIFTPSSSGTYQFLIKAVDNSGNYSTIPATCTLGVTLEPSQVQNFNINQQETDRSYLELSWGANSETNISHYEIRKGSDWQSGEIIATQLKATKFLYKLTQEGLTTFWIKAVNTSGYYSVNASSKQLQVMLRPDAPSNVTAMQDTKDRSIVNLKWAAVSGKDIDGYQITVGSSVYFTKELSYRYQAISSGNYSFSVQSKTVAGYYSKATACTVVITVEPLDVTGFTASQSIQDRTKVTLTWGKSSELDIAYYTIKLGQSWDSGEIIGNRITGTFFETKIADESKKSFWIKATTIAGHDSLSPAEVEGIYNLNPDSVTNISLSQDTDNKSILNISWTSILESDLAYYSVRIGSVWETAKEIAQTKECRCTYKIPTTGDIKVMIKAMNVAGFYSDEASEHLYCELEPTQVQNFRVFQNGEYVELFWDKHQEPDVVSYEIREGSFFDGSSLVATGVTVCSYKYKVSTERDYRYHIKAINRSGNYSLASASANVTVANLPPKNVINEYDQITLANGTHNNTEFGTSLINFSNIGGKFSDYKTTKFSDIGGQTVLKLKQRNLLDTSAKRTPVVYNNYSANMTATITPQGTTYKGEPVYRLTITPTNATGVTQLATREYGHGLQYINEKISYLLNTYYCASVYWKAISAKPVTMSGTSSNISGWSNIGTSIDSNGWNITTSRRYHSTTQSDCKYWSIMCPTVTLNEPVIIDFCCPQIEVGDTPTEFGSYFSSGEYTAVRMDMGMIITANIASRFVSTILYTSGVNTRLQYRTSGDGINFTDWADFQPVLATFRYIDFKTVLSTTDVAKTPEVNHFTITVDVPDAEVYKTVTVAAGGATIPYGKTFYSIPTVTPTAIGENLYAQVISKSKTEVTIKVKNSSSVDVGGTVDLRVKGY